MDCKLNIVAGSEIPRYTFKASQCGKDNSQKLYLVILDHMKVTNEYVHLNCERYREENLNIDFSKNHHSKLFKILLDIIINIVIIINIIKSTTII